MSEPELPILPLLPLREVVCFPNTVLPLNVARKSSLAAVDFAVHHDRVIFLTTQKQTEQETPSMQDIYSVGCIAKILQVVKGPERTVKVLVEGVARAIIKQYQEQPLFNMVQVMPIKEQTSDSNTADTFGNLLRESYRSFLAQNNNIPKDLLQRFQKANSGALADLIAMNLNINTAERQEVLEEDNHEKRCELVLTLMERQKERSAIEQKIQSKVRKQIEKNNKEYFLHEQMKAIREELGEAEDFQSEIEAMQERLKKKIMPDEARSKAQKELNRLKTMNANSPETTMARTYVDWILDLPWQEYSQDNINLKKAESILNKDHYGLDKVKDRILEFLAVQSLVGDNKGQILCLVGPPGVGKTSMGRSIARCMGRKFVRVSLGGVRDEATIRGHRRTYVGALPGRIIQSIKRAGSGNPLLLLDEIDKLASDNHGDPAAALLEVLDPEVNSTFSDHYLELDYDLSKVLFICTANNIQGIPPALMDRMEIIRIPGYTEEEKCSICQKYLLPKQKEANGLGQNKLNWNQAASRYLIRNYTKEAGVRSLEREVGKICRKLACKTLKERAFDPNEIYTVNQNVIRELLGPEKYSEFGKEAQSEVGLANGLAWTEVGGTVLQIEVAVMEGTGKIQLTGKLGDVMKESAQAAMSYVRSRAPQLGLPSDVHNKYDIHIHVPEGATPKDGPSAGITMVTALVSALTGIPVNTKVAMTGEITLRGRVLPIGGLKEKALAAYQVGCKKVIIPQDNVKDLEEIPEKIRSQIEFIPVGKMDEVLQAALLIPENDPLLKASLAPELLLGIRSTQQDVSSFAQHSI